jgi:hypothetical protein
MKNILKILLMILIKLKQEKITVSVKKTLFFHYYTEINKREVIINLNVLPEYNNNFTKEKFKRTLLYNLIIYMIKRIIIIETI